MKVGGALVVAEASWQLVGQDVPSLHSAAFVLQTVHPVAEGVPLGAAAQRDSTYTPTGGTDLQFLSGDHDCVTT